MLNRAATLEDVGECRDVRGLELGSGNDRDCINITCGAQVD